MKKKFLVIQIIMLFLLSGCTSGLFGEKEDALTVSGAEESTEGESYYKELLKEQLSENKGEEIYSNGEVEIALPKEWTGKCIVSTTDTGIYIYQKASFDLEEESGFLCALIREDNVTDIPERYEIAYADDAIYYFQLPTDVSCVDDEAICEEYISMTKSYLEMRDYITIKRSDVYFDADEYICPMSRTKEIPDEVLMNLSPNSLSFARNEIYARHGRKFTNQFISDYFSEYSWYTPSIEPEDFDESILSEIEKRNIEKIVVLEAQYKEKEHFPEPLVYGQEYSFDLDGDGIKETLRLRYEDMDNYAHYGVEIMINGKVVMEAQEWIASLTTRGYYVTDIDEKSPGLEIAISDFGESDDPTTHFFYYDGKINYIGYVYSMSESKYTLKDNVLTGFDGKIAGVIRADVFYTCFAEAAWEYSYEKKSINIIEQEMYQMQPDGPYELTEDIKIYRKKSTDSELITLKAQNIFFLESDAESWMKVKGEDGVTGYLHKNDDWEIDSVGKRAEDIIMNLRFAG